MSQTDIKKQMEIAEKEKKDLETRAKQNESFKEALTNFTTVLLNFFTIFQPILAFFGTILKFLTDYKYVTMSLIAAFVTFQAFAKAELVGKFVGGFVNGAKSLRGIFSPSGVKQAFGGIKDTFKGVRENFSKGFAGGATEKVTEGATKITAKKSTRKAAQKAAQKATETTAQTATQTAARTTAPKVSSKDSKGFAGFMRGIRDGFAVWKTQKGTDALVGALKFGSAMAIVVAPLMAISLIYKALGGSFTDLALLGLVLVELAGSLALMSYAMNQVKIQGIMQGVLALTLLNIPLLAFAGVASLFSNIDWETFAKMAVVMVGGIAIIAGIGALMNAGGLALVIAGAAGLIIAAAAIGAFGLGLLVASPGFQAMANIDWNGLSGMALTLFALAPAILAFAGAGLLLLNPLMLLGMVTMIAALSSLAFVMSILGPNFEKAGNGMSSMATGVEKLSAALSSISDDTLDKLKAIGESVGDAAALTAAVNALTVATGGGGGKGGTPQTFQIEVVVKNEDGRTIQKRIIKDTELLK